MTHPRRQQYSLTPSFIFTTARKLKRKAGMGMLEWGRIEGATVILLVAVILVVECRHHEADPHYNYNDQFHRRHRRYPDNLNNSSFPNVVGGGGGGAEPKSENNGFFVQIPHSNPPTVRPPPYTISYDKCLPLNVRENWIDTLCGDLNTGLVPQNPMGHKFFDGGTYPFETIKNKTLDFFRRALPILKSDKSLPKVAKFAQLGNFAAVQAQQLSQHLYRAKRGIATREPADSSPLLFDASYPDSYYYDDPAPAMLSTRQRRQHREGSGAGGSGFCENRIIGYYNRLCKLYNAMWGKSPHNIQRDNSHETRRQIGSSGSNLQSHHHPNHGHPHYPNQHNPKKHFRQAFHTRPDMTVGESDWTKASKHLNTVGSAPASSNSNPSPSPELPPTPCPSAAEYLTPVFARNHEGAWRYVVQIPKEGYFTQTVEVTKCLKSNCFYMDGSCKTSPRWQSLLVAELFYPETTFPTTPKPSFSPPTVQKTTTTTSRRPKPIASILGDQENYPDYLYSKGQSSASLENLSGGVNYSNELGLPFKKRSIRSVKETSSSSKTSGGSTTSACDGYDDVGCYQVRLFYDWFLIPGSCKCWKRQFDFTMRANHG